MNRRQWFRTFFEALVLDIRVIWLALIVPVAVVFVVHRARPSLECPAVLVMSASLLQILGIGQVAWGLHQLRVDLGQPTLRSVFVDWLRKLKSLLPFTKQPVRVITGTGGLSLGGSAAFARGVVVNPASIESRVDALEKQVKWLQEDFQKQTGEINRRIDSFSAETRTALAKREAETVELRKLLDRVLMGGFDLEVAGLAWIVIGQVLTTWPRGFASLISGLFC